MKILRTPNAGGKWIAVQRGLLERATVALRLPTAKQTDSRPSPVVVSGPIGAKAP
jgi:hypothetical protein